MSGDLRAAVDPVDEMVDVLRETMRANDVMFWSASGADYFNEATAIENVARGLLARKVVEPSRAIIPEGAVLATEETLAAALRSCVGIEPDDNSRQDYGDINGGALLRPTEAAAAILRHLREGT